MRFLLLTLVMALCGFSALAEDELLSKDAHDIFQQHAADFYHTSEKIENDLQLSIPDERVLLHLPKRGFPYLTALIKDSNLYTYAASTLFMPELTLKSSSHEEAVAGELVGRAMIIRLAANQNACFHLLKQLAPTAQAMTIEQHAKELFTKIDVSNETTFLLTLENIRTLFDQLKDLPKLTAEQYANEREQSAVLAPREYHEERNRLPVDERKWTNREVKWHQNFDHAGYILAYSELNGPDDYEQRKLVVNQTGGIFEWNQPYDGSHEHPDSYESKLPGTELHALEDFITTLPPLDAEDRETHFVVSFLKNGIWTTHIYNALPEACPFEKMIKRMVTQSARWWRPGNSGPEFLDPYPDIK